MPDNQEFDPTIYDATMSQNPAFTSPRMQDILLRQNGATPPFIPPGQNELDAAIEAERKKYFGTQQRYDETGAPRKMKWYEKLGTAMQMAAELGSGGKSSGNRYEDVIRDRAEKGIEIGQKERIAKIAADQKAEAARAANETNLEKIKQNALHQEATRKLKALSDAGAISLKEAQAALVLVNAAQIEGRTNGTTLEGALLAAKTQAQTGLIGAQTDKTNLRTPDQILLDLNATPEKLARASGLINWKAELDKYKKDGSDKGTAATGGGMIRTKEIDPTTGAERTVSQKIMIPGSPSAPARSLPPVPGVFGGTGTAPVASSVTPAVSSAAPTAVSPRLQSAAIASQAPVNTTPSKPAVFEKTAATNFDSPDFTPNPALFKKGGFVNAGMGAATRKSKEFIDSSSLHTNEIISAMAAGNLDKFSGFYGTPMGDAIRRMLGTLSPEEGAIRRLSINSIAKAESSDFGNRPMKILIDAERSGMQQPWYKAANMVASGVGRHYMLVLNSWLTHGDEKQKKLAEDIINSPARLHALSDSMQYYALDVINAGKSKNLGAAPLPTNLYVLSRTDDELKRMYPGFANMPPEKQKLALAVIRATGGKTENYKTPPKKEAPIAEPSMIDKLRKLL